MASTNSALRIRIVSLAICIFALLIIAKLFYLQVIHGEGYTERADRQYATPAGDIFERGSIYFSRKDGELVSAATMVSGFKIAIDTNKLVDPEATYTKIAEIIPVDRELFMQKAAKQNDPYEEVALRIAKSDADRVNALDLPGVSIYKEKWRFYPGLSMAANTLGFVGYKGDELGGRYGLERYYNDVLSRENESLYVNFFAEVFSNINDAVFKDDTREGDIVTSIEPTVQNMLERELDAVRAKWSSDAVGGIIMNPRDGSMYALAVRPTFDVNLFSKVEDPHIYANPLVEDVYEFGSVIKALTMASGLDAGAVTAATTYNDKGYIVLNKARINNFDLKGRGIVPMQEVLSQSLNTGVVFVMEQMGRELFRDYMLRYGISEKTGIDLPNETSGLVENLKSTREIEYATASFGQGIALTPVEAARALAVLGNGGKLVTPHIAKAIRYDDGSEKLIEYPAAIQVLKPETSSEISRMLTTVVDKALLGGTVKQEHYSIAAKTGTAQMAREDGRGYYEDRYLHSFFGYFPSYDPQFLILLYNIHPKNVDYASKTLTDPFISLTKFLLSYYDVPPDR